MRNTGFHGRRGGSVQASARPSRGVASTGAAVSTAAETLIPLSRLTRYEFGNTPLSVNHQGLFVATTISFNLAIGRTLSDAVSYVNRTMHEIGVPATIHGSFQGTARAFQQSLNHQLLVVLAALAAIYIVLGILYESYIHPLTILSGLPSAAFGALLTLILFHMELNIYAFVGMIMLIGIVEKNAIMQVDFALEAERGGMSSEQAIYQGCLIRFRPIMMTTMAALLGAVPIAIGFGAGGEARQPLGVAVIGGLLFSQLVTLYLTPVFFTYMARLQQWMRSRRATEMAPAPAQHA